jgi:branched-chain amino acid transport system substrate-binding protein
MRLVGRMASAALLVAISACSVLLDDSPSQCSTDADCRGRGAEFATSVCYANRCVGADARPCATNSECTSALGVPAVCRARDHRCGALLTPECARTAGDVTSDDAIIFGSIFAVTGTNGPAGEARERSAEVALNEIKVSVGGIRNGAGGVARPLGLVECDDNLDSIKPAMHLVDDVGVAAIVGVASSSRAIDVATGVTIPKGVLLITPTATSVAITSLADANLVWRTAPSDELQALVLVDQLSALEAEYRTRNTIAAATNVHATLLYINDAYGLGLFEAVTRDGRLNGKPIGDPANAGLTNGISYPPSPPDLDMQVSAILAQSPRPAIVLGFGSTELVTKLVALLEAQWGTTAPRPLYLFSDAVQKTELLDLVSGNDALRMRIRGSVPAAPRSSSNFQSFVFKYEGMFGAPAPEVFGMAGTYDSIFLLAYSVAAAGSRPLTGDELQKGFGRLVSGAPINVGGTSMNVGFQALTSPGTFDFDGASGPLDFDVKTGEARSNIEVWCIAQTAGMRPSFVASGRLFDAKMNQLTGTYDFATCKSTPPK